MTNGELFIKENPTVETKINGSCVWIYFDGVNHYTMPVEWWEQEISLFDKLRAEIEALDEGISNYHNDRPWIFKDEALDIIDKYRNEVSE